MVDGSLVGCSPWGREESDTTEGLHFPFSLSCIGEGNGNPLQCSCLENPRDGGAWWAAVYGVAQSRTRLKRLSSSSSLKLDSGVRLSELKSHLAVYWLRTFQGLTCKTGVLMRLPDRTTWKHQHTAGQVLTSEKGVFVTTPWSLKLGHKTKF